jgi:hypothetical protein
MKVQLLLYEKYGMIGMFCGSLYDNPLLPLFSKGGLKRNFIFHCAYIGHGRSFEES